MITHLSQIAHFLETKYTFFGHLNILLISPHVALLIVAPGPGEGWGGGGAGVETVGMIFFHICLNIVYHTNPDVNCSKFDDPSSLIAIQFLGCTLQDVNIHHTYQTCRPILNPITL